MRTTTKPGVFYGWWVVVVSLVVLLITLGLGYYSFGVFFNSLIADFGWSRATLSGAMSIFLIAWGLACPLAGRLTDYYGPRRLIVWGALALGASLCCLSQTRAWWHLYLLYAAAGAASAAGSEIPVSTALSNWFHKRRGTAMGIASTGIGLGGLFLAPAIGWLIPNFGWRTTFTIMGVLTWAIIIPLAALVIRTAPQAMGLLPDGEVNGSELPPHKDDSSSTKNSNFSQSPAAAAAGRKELYVVGVAFSLVSFGIIGITTHEVPYLIDIGIPLATAATALGLTGGLGVLGKLLSGYLADRFSPRWLFIICTALQAGGVVILMQSRNLAMVWAFVVVFALAMGGANTLRPLVIGELFGIAGFGATFGLTEFIRRLGAAAGVFLAGYIFDITGSYQYALAMIVIAYLAGIAVLLLPSRTRR